MSKYMMAWLPMALLAIANGVIRDIGYGRQLRLFFVIILWAVVRVWQAVEGASGPSDLNADCHHLTGAVHLGTAAGLAAGFFIPGRHSRPNVVAANGSI
jgi:hypothetical protein